MSHSAGDREPTGSYDAEVLDAVLFDFGGVVTASPFDGFAAYEREAGLPPGFVRRINSTNPDANAWARLERNEVDFEQFCDLFEAEARSLGHDLSAHRVFECLNGALRPDMVEAIRRCGERLLTACLTNNVVRADGTRTHEEILAMFDVVVESSRVGIRKPDPRFYLLACEQLAVAPEKCAFLDDLGINLKPAAALGMTTIKVTTSDQAIAELEHVVGFPLR